MNEDEAMDTIHKKIQRERDLIDGSIAMRRSTNNPAVLSRLDTQIRDGRKNIEYLEGRLHELKVPPAAPELHLLRASRYLESLLSLCGCCAQIAISPPGTSELGFGNEKFPCVIK